MQQPEWQSVVDLMLFDERNPRSARFQLAKLAKHVRLLPDAGLLDVLADVERLLDDCRSDSTAARASCSARRAAARDAADGLSARLARLRSR